MVSALEGVGTSVVTSFFKNVLIYSVFLQETKCENFSASDFCVLGGTYFSWNWVPAVGSSRGILIGSKDNMFDVSDVIVAEFYLSIRLVCRDSSETWDIISVQDPSDHAHTLSVWS